MDFGKLLETAWEAYKRNAGQIIATAIVLGIVGIALAGLTLFPMMAGNAGRMALDFTKMLGALAPAMLVLWLFGVYASTAMLVLFRDSLEGTASMGRALNEGLRRFGQMLVAQIVLLVVAGAPLAVGVYATTATGFSAGGIVALVVMAIVALYLAIRLIWAPAYVVTKDLGGVEAVQASWQDTGKDLGRALGYVVIAAVLGIVGWIVDLIPLVGALVTALLINPLIGLAYVAAAKG